MKDIWILVVFIMSINVIFSQNLNFKKVESDLIIAFEDFKNASYKDRYDSLSPKFKTKIKSVLSLSESFQYNFDTLSKYITIVVSPDNKVKLFSWDELGGGSWHDMTVLVQYRTAQNKVNTQYIDAENAFDTKGYTNAIQHSLYTIQMNQKSYYLALGWGTYGGGQHHGSILIFSIENGVFKNCSSCVSEEYSEINASRSSKIDLAYNEEQHLISFNESIYDEEMGFYEPTGNKVYLKLVGNMFQKIKQ